MKKVLKLISLVSALALLVVTAVMLGTYAKPEYAKKEKQTCKYCHTSKKPSKDDLSDAGKYARDHDHSLKGYKPKEEKPKS